LVFNNENILTPKYDIRVAIANRGLEAISNGKNVNLGIGIPTLLSSIDQKGKTINWQS
jgi:acyl CoA:acetate/3-ketoacid CoA transferase beta subunit